MPEHRWPDAFAEIRRTVHELQQRHQLSDEAVLSLLSRELVLRTMQMVRPTQVPTPPTPGGA